MNATIQRTQPRIFPVNSRPDGAVYLVMEECASGHGVLIRQSARTKSKLGRYWRVWVHELLLKLDDKYIKEIMFTSKGVVFVSEKLVDDWVWAITSLLANVVPLGDLPMWQPAHDREGFWRVDKRADLTEIIADITLPDTARKFFTLHGGDYYVELRRSGVGRNKCPLPIGVVMRMVELQVARACYSGGVPINWEVVVRRDQMRRSRELNHQPPKRRRPVKRRVVTVELPRPARKRRRTVRGKPVERGDA